MTVANATPSAAGSPHAFNPYKPVAIAIGKLAAVAVNNPDETIALGVAAAAAAARLVSKSAKPPVGLVIVSTVAGQLAGFLNRLRPASNAG